MEEHEDMDEGEAAAFAAGWDAGAREAGNLAAPVFGHGLAWPFPPDYRDAYVRGYLAARALADGGDDGTTEP
ncbi:MAG TPA: hypothetical protein VNN12_05420 [Dehalococcoidia bacterium]|nr:hypothetical protein [Dehalococcoidia bacterium]